MRIYRLVIFFAAYTLLSQAQSQLPCSMRTLAGRATTAAGDGGPASVAQLFEPEAIVFDSSGNLYVADSRNNRIRKISPGGIITTIAGTGAAGFSGDGGRATNAELRLPSGVAIDLKRNLYIADTGNHRIRKVNPDGIIATIVGTGIGAFAGDGGPAVMAELSSPAGLTIDESGNLYVADAGNHRIRRVGANGVITTVAGKGICDGYCADIGDGGLAIQASLVAPQGVAIDSRGRLIIADTENWRIRAVDENGVITTIAGPGSGASAGVDRIPAKEIDMLRIRSVVAEADGSILVPAGAIWRVTPDGLATSIAKGGYYGSQIAADAHGNLYLSGYPRYNYSFLYPARALFAADFLADTIQRLPAGGAGPVPFAGVPAPGFSGDGGPANLATLGFPSGIAVDDHLNVYIADSGNLRIRKIEANGIMRTIAGTGELGCYKDLGDGGPALAARFCGPMGIGVDGSGNVFVADSRNDRIRKIAAGGTISTVAGGGWKSPPPTGMEQAATDTQLRDPRGLAVSRSGDLYLLALENSPRLLKVTPDGKLRTIVVFVSGIFPGCCDASNRIFSGMAVDNLGNVFINKLQWATSGDDKIIKVDPSGGTTILSAVGRYSDTLLSATVDSVGNLYLAEFGGRLKKLTPDGKFGTIYNRDFQGYSAEQGLLSAAEPPNYVAIAAGGDGQLYIADRENHKIRVLSAGGCEASIGPRIEKIRNSATLLTGQISPGLIVAINGTGLGPAEGVLGVYDLEGRIATALAGTRILFDGIPAPLTFVREDQVNCVVPFEVSGRSSVWIEVEPNGVRSDAVKASVMPTSPGIFGTEDGRFSRWVAMLNEDGTRNSAQNPARRGSVVAMWATGLGLSDKANSTGRPAKPPYGKPRADVRLICDEKEIKPEYLGNAPDLVEGASQVNFRVPDGPPGPSGATGLVQLRIGLNGSSDKAFFYVF
jgi:uncharacterized protein (TIGR03437 family)